MNKNHHKQSNKRTPQSNGSNRPATVYVTETVVLLSPTTTIVLADAPGGTSAELERVASLDQKIIIILSSLCFGLLCVVAGLLIWYRKKPIRGKRGQWEERGEARRMSIRPSPLLVARSPSSPDDRSSRTMSTNYSGQHLCPRIPREEGARTPEPLFDSERSIAAQRGDTETERKPKPSHLNLDPAPIRDQKDGRFGLTVPWTAGFGSEASNYTSARPARTTRAISYPSDAHLHSPHTPDSSYPLVPLSQPPPGTSIPPSPTHSSSLHHRRLHGAPISLPPLDIPTPTKAGHSVPPISPPVAESIPGMPPSPPPSPATITSRNPASRSESFSNQGQDPHTRPPSSPPCPENPTSPTSRPMTAASDTRPLTSSTHLSLTSSYSAGSSTRFSSLFFAPQGSTPPKDEPITEAVGKEGDFAER